MRTYLDGCGLYRAAILIGFFLIVCISHGYTGIDTIFQVVHDFLGVLRKQFFEWEFCEEAFKG